MLNAPKIDPHIRIIFLHEGLLKRSIYSPHLLMRRISQQAYI
jgi:hypothetical protein